MATDNTVLGAAVGTGDTVKDLAEAATGAKAQVVTVAYVSGGSAGAWTFQVVDGTHGLPVSVLGTVPVSGTVGVSGSVAVTGTFWQATQPVSGTVTANQGAANATPWNENLAQVGGAAFALGQQLAAASLPVVLTAAQLTTLTPPSTVTANQGGAPWSVSQSGAWNVGTVTTLTGITNTVTVQGGAASGAAAAGNPVQAGGVFNTTQPTVTTGQAVQLQATARGASIVATGVDTFHVTVDAAPTTTVTGTVTANQGGAPWAENITQLGGTAVATGNGVTGPGTLRVTLSSDGTGQVTLAAGAQVIGALTANQSVNLNQVAGSAVATGHGTAAGAVRVELPTDGTGVVGLNAGGNLVGKVGVDQTTPGSTNGVTPVPATSGGPTVNRVKSAATTNATSVKASAGQVYGWYLFNNTASEKFLKFYNKASAPAVGADTPFFTVPLPPNGGSNIEFSMGVPFGTGIAYAITGAVTDADTTATAADDVHGMILTK